MVNIFMTFRDLLNLLSRSCFPVKMLDENIHAAICLIHLQFPVFKLVQHQIILGFNLRIILVLDEYKLFIEQFLVFSCFFLECYKNIFDLRTIASLLSPWTASTIAVSQYYYRIIFISITNASNTDIHWYSNESSN